MWASHLVKHEADDRFHAPVVENLWMNGAFPVDDLSLKISFDDDDATFRLRRDFGCAFVPGFACLLERQEYNATSLHKNSAGAFST